MAKFKYKLQNVLDIKYRMEEQAKANFASAQARLSEEEEKRDSLIQRLRDYEEEAKRLRETVLNVIDIRDNGRAIENIKGQIAAQIKKVEQAEKVVEQARIRLTDAVQDRKIHEKLKENSFEEFIRETNAAESKEIDELVSYTYGERIKKNNQVKPV